MPKQTTKSNEQTFKLKLKSISVKDDEKNWSLKAQSLLAFDETKKKYTASIVVDQEFFDNQVNKVNKEIEKVIANPDLFENWEEDKKDLEKEIDEINKTRNEYAGDEIHDFDVRVHQVDYTAQTLVFVLEQETVLDIVQVRERFEGYIMNLH